MSLLQQLQNQIRECKDELARCQKKDGSTRSRRSGFGGSSARGDTNGSISGMSILTTSQAEDAESEAVASSQNLFVRVSGMAEGVARVAQVADENGQDDLSEVLGDLAEDLGNIADDAASMATHITNQAIRNDDSRRSGEDLDEESVVSLVQDSVHAAAEINDRVEEAVEDANEAARAAGEPDVAAALNAVVDATEDAGDEGVSDCIKLLLTHKPTVLKMNSAAVKEAKKTAPPKPRTTNKRRKRNNEPLSETVRDVNEQLDGLRRSQRSNFGVPDERLTYNRF